MRAGINRNLVASGYAVAFRRYALDYASEERSAKPRRLGIWSGTFEMPSAYRQGECKAGSTKCGTSRPPLARAVPRGLSAHPHEACRIKGNRNRKGQRIYHMPGMPFHDRTRAEQIFCSEGEAKAAGYRRAIVR